MPTEGYAELHGYSKPQWEGLKLDTHMFTGLLVLVQVIFFVYAIATNLGYGEVDLNAQFYAMFIDVSIMIFFGFGFLMTFLRRHGYSAVGLCVITSAVVIQLSLIVEPMFNFDDTRFSKGANLFTLINGLFCAGAVMISMGAVLGKVSPSQLLAMGIIETVLYFLNFWLYTSVFKASDAAGGICLHAFGAYFGLVVAKSLTTSQNLDHKDNTATYSSDMFSLMGTLFLWLLWPSFCGAVASEKDGTMFLAVTNTFIGLIGSVIGFAALSRVLHGGEFNIVEMQNATLAGGVAMGVAADQPLTPGGALCLGLLAGLLSVFGYAKVDLGKIGIMDTCGVHNLHGMPGLLGGIATLGLFDWQKQVFGILATLGIAIVGGLVTGEVLKIFPGVGKFEFFNDDAYWEVAEDYKLE